MHYISYLFVWSRLEKSSSRSYLSLLVFSLCWGALRHGQTKTRGTQSLNEIICQNIRHMHYVSHLFVWSRFEKVQVSLSFSLLVFSLSGDALRSRQTKTRGTQSLDEIICQNIMHMHYLSYCSLEPIRKKIKSVLAFYF